jgi:hypothetical protein
MKTEVSPGVWRLRVFAGRRANGTPIQITKTIHAPGENPKPGAGSRLADSELAKMVSRVADRIPIPEPPAMRVLAVVG